MFPFLSLSLSLSLSWPGCGEGRDVLEVLLALYCGVDGRFFFFLIHLDSRLLVVPCTAAGRTRAPGSRKPAAPAAKQQSGHEHEPDFSLVETSKPIHEDSVADARCGLLCLVGRARVCGCSLFCFPPPFFFVSFTLPYSPYSLTDCECGFCRVLCSGWVMDDDDEEEDGAGLSGGGEGQDEALAADLAKFEEHKAAEEERQRLAEQVNARLQQEEEEARRKEEEVKRQAALDEERFVNCLCMCVCVCALGGGEGCFVLFFFFCLLLLPVAACFLRPVPGACSN